MDVLIVERDELIAEVLSDALSADGISVAIMPNEEEAMRACRDGSPRVVITGINRRSEDIGTVLRSCDAGPLPVACCGLHGGSLASAIAPVRPWYPGAVPHQADRHAEVGAHRSRASGNLATSMMYVRSVSKARPAKQKGSVEVSRALAAPVSWEFSGGPDLPKASACGASPANSPMRPHSLHGELNSHQILRHDHQCHLAHAVVLALAGCTTSRSSGVPPPSAPGGDLPLI